MLGMPPYWRPSKRFCTARVAFLPNLKGECNDASPKNRLFTRWTAGELFSPYIELFVMTARELFDLTVSEQFAPIAGRPFALIAKKLFAPTVRELFALTAIERLALTARVQFALTLKELYSTFPNCYREQ